MENKDLIIQDLKDVIVDLNSKFKDVRNALKMAIQLRNEAVKLRNKETVINNEKQFKLINDLNICQSANKRQSEIIKELQLENSEVNKLLSTYKFSFYLIASIVTIVSVVCSIITLI